MGKRERGKRLYPNLVIVLVCLERQRKHGRKFGRGKTLKNVKVKNCLVMVETETSYLWLELFYAERFVFGKVSVTEQAMKHLSLLGQDLVGSTRAN